MSESKIIKAKAEVEKFLEQFKIKMDIWGVLFLIRDKNEATIREMGLVDANRKAIVKNISADDYVETILHELAACDMWVFGKEYGNVPLYIKITLGQPNSTTVCISFHKAEHPLKYAFK